MVKLFKSLAEESRLRILSLLVQDERCVCEIEDYLKMTQSNASRHLTALKQCGILDSYKKAQWTFYKVSDTFIKENGLLWEYLQKMFKEDANYRIDVKVNRNCN